MTEGRDRTPSVPLARAAHINGVTPPSTLPLSPLSALTSAPSSISAEIRPFTFTSPLVGFVMPATSFSAVLLPDPLRPITPNVDPVGTVKERSFTAAKLSAGARSRITLLRSRALFSVEKCRPP